MNAPLVPIAIVFLLGVVLGMRLAIWPLGILSSALASAALVWGQRHDSRSSVQALRLLWLCLGILRAHLWLAHPACALADRLPETPQSVRLHGLIVSDPTPLFSPHDGEQAVSVIRLLHVRAESEWRPLAGSVRATFEAPHVALAYGGDEVLVEGAWSCVPAAANPGAYDWRSALARQRIHGLLAVKPWQGVVVLRHRSAMNLFGWIGRLRQRSERLLRDAFSPQEAGLFCALLLGERVALDEELKQRFVETGTIHSLARQCTKLHQAASASHVTI